MDFSWLNTFTYIGIVYAILYTGSKLIFSIMSLLEIKIYFWRYDHIIEEHELEAHLRKNKHEMPLISIISPAFNEGVLIIDTVSSFLNQSYKNKEVIICSDGGTDGTLEKLIEHFDLVEVNESFPQSQNITCKTIKRYLRSTNPAYRELLVLDKENGGKADAQNAGVAVAKGEIITIIDADSILEKYALIHLADIFERERRVVGIGTPIGVLNDCNVGPDGVDDASVPKSFWAKIQVIEYLRSFLLGRMYAQRYRGLQIVSGAFGVYKKWILEAVGGYSTGSLAEDMDIDGKIWRHIDTHKLKYRIRYIPEAFCWSEVPDTFKSLASQRDRWARGMTETIWKNKDLFFNPKFKLLGLFSYPYYVFFEWLTPFIEIIGILYFIIGAALGWFSFYIVGYIFLLYWGIGILLNITALSVEAYTRGHYKNRLTLVRLSLYALLEPLFYHWINSYLYVTGNLKLLFFRKTGWGEMERVGIKKAALPDETYPVLSLHQVSSNPVRTGNGNEKAHSFTYITPADNSGSGNKKISSSTRFITIICILILLVTVAWYYFIYTAQFTDKLTTSNRDRESILKSTEPPAKSEITAIQQPDSLNSDYASELIIPAEQNAVDETMTEQSKVHEEVKTIPVIERVGTIDTVTQASGTYYIIIASTQNSDLARKYVTKLSKQGISLTLILPPEGEENIRISIDRTTTFREAYNKLPVWAPTYGDQVWILKY